MEDQSTLTPTDVNFFSKNDNTINDGSSISNGLEEQEVTNRIELSAEDETNLVTIDPVMPATSSVRSDSGNGDDKRLHCLDLLRGLIVAIMAWDHCKDFLSLYRGNDGTKPGDTTDSGWGKHTEAYAGELEMFSGKFQYFFARAVSHICAPGFSFLMGVGMIMLKESRMRNSGWDKARVCRFFVVRGIVLILLGFVVRAAFLIVPPPIHQAKHINRALADLFGFFQVMTSLGLSMITAAPLVTHALPCLTTEATRETDSSAVSEPSPMTDSSAAPLLLPSNHDTPNSDVRHPTSWKKISIIWTVCTLLASAILAIEQYLVWSRQGSDPGKAHMAGATTFGEILLRFTFVPGEFGSIPSLDYYPFLPWFAITLFGIAFGASLVLHSCRGQMIKSCTAYSGLSLLFAFVLVRFFGGRVFSMRGWPLNEGRAYPLISFLNVCKYPPSVSYILLTMGINLLLLNGFSRIGHPDKYFLSRFLWTFGRVPLAFYVLHFYLITTIAVIIRAATGGVPGIPLSWVILVWLGVLVIMKGICDHYAAFKAKTSPESIWRFF
eukprot:CAMPEP_0194226398 /NCGR_PEP_ID=MMETSP0156-20130528/41740_1 /TAXON_ID=33649 /ORGANISM="Thalassionema nitzschioides, Strain L26-B" /LENGTH=550 /DNA_ID=CAMNT_0038958737 /DNA_START=82 /DNA_END=1734 /DNA_ORIENTATION=-